MQVIVVLFVLIFGVYLLSDKLITQKNVVLQTSAMLRVRFALNSVLDYMYYNIQRRSCLDESLLASTEQCQLGTMKGGGIAPDTAALLDGPHVLAPGARGGNARSLERVLLSYNLAHNIETMIDVNCIDLQLERTFRPNGTGPQDCRPVIGTLHPTTHVLNYNEGRFSQVDTMEIVVPAQSISPQHPLFPVVEPVYQALHNELVDSGSKLERKRLDFSIRVNVHRDDSAAVVGSETYFTITVQFEDANGKLLVANRVPLKMVSYGTLYPRENGTFALMVARDLRLDGAGTSMPNVSIPAFAEWDGGPRSGMIFHSPVFVNGDLHLPKPSSGTHFSGEGLYSPVTFADRVILGSGWIYEGDQLFKPDTAGGKHDMFWSDHRLLGGLKMGALIDNAWDNGLMRFGEFSVGNVDTSFYQKCLARNNAKAATQFGSELYAGRQPGGAGVFDWVLGIADFGTVTGESMTAVDFNPQHQAVPPPETDAATGFVKADLSKPGSSAPLGDAILQLQVTMGQQTVTAYMPWNSKLTLQPQIGDVRSPQDTGDSALLQKLHDTPAQYDEALDAMRNPGTVTIEVKGVSYERDESTPPSASFPSQENHLAELKVAFSRDAKKYIDPTGAPLSTQIRIVAMDGRYQHGTAISTVPQAALDRVKRYLSIQNDGVSLVADDNLRAQPSSDPLSDPYDSLQITNQFVSARNFDAAAYLNFDKKCEQAAGRSTGQSFGAAAWNVDLAPSAAAMRLAWNNANLSGAPGEVVCTPDDTPVTASTSSSLPRYSTCSYTFSAGGLDIGGTPEHPGPLPMVQSTAGGPWRTPFRDDFRTLSIVKSCVIEPSARLVTGFFTCDSLTILPRSQPLYIIGTFIVKELDIQDPLRTLKAGVHWYSIYHPDALGILRYSRVLRPISASTGPVEPPVCDDALTSLPIWDVTGLSLQRQGDLRSCNAISLRAKNGNFTWSAVDPDCGPLPNSGGSLCKNHPVNYLVTEHGRGGGP